METTPKFVHIAKSRRGGQFVVNALCGRRVGFLSTTSDAAHATCTKCLAVAKSTQEVG